MKYARALVSLALGAAMAAGLPARAAARAFTLPELLELARTGNPGLHAGAQATAGIEAQLLEARRSWLPSGDLQTLVGPIPNIECRPEPDFTPPVGASGGELKTWREGHCFRTNVADATLNFRGIGVFTRTELRLVQPVYTFGKISAGVAAAEAGISASKYRESGMAADLDLNVRKAYWGAKLAREVLETLNEGLGYIDDAEKKIDKDLKEGTGTVTVTDRLRVQWVRSQVEAKVLEARKMAALARSGLRALVGPDAPADLDVDAGPLAAVDVPERPLSQYEEQARLSRPEVKALDFLVASKRALADFEKRKLYPDLVLVGTAAYAYASSVDNPKNAFASDPYNTLYAGIGAALRLPLDFGVKDARAARVRAEAEETAQRRREALGGVAFEVERAYGEVTEARERNKVAARGEQATRRWRAAIAQSFTVGTAEPRDVTEALLAYFQGRVAYLQSLFDMNTAAAALSRACGTEVTR